MQPLYLTLLPLRASSDLLTPYFSLYVLPYAPFRTGRTKMKIFWDIFFLENLDLNKHLLPIPKIILKKI